jgi:hypothetical protein
MKLESHTPAACATTAKFQVLAKPWPCLQAAQDRADLNIELLPGLIQDPGVTDEAELEASARRWSSLVVDICTSPASHIALTPALAAKRSRSEYVWRCAKYAAASCACLTGMVVLYTVVSHVLGSRADASSSSSKKESGSRVSGALRASTKMR